MKTEPISRLYCCRFQPHFHCEIKVTFQWLRTRIQLQSFQCGVTNVAAQPISSEGCCFYSFCCTNYPFSYSCCLEFACFFFQLCFLLNDEFDSIDSFPPLFFVLHLLASRLRKHKSSPEILQIIQSVTESSISSHEPSQMCVSQRTNAIMSRRGNTDLFQDQRSLLL